jgi:hypothetical protein
VSQDSADKGEKIRVTDRRTSTGEEGGAADPTRAEREAGERAYTEAAGSCVEPEDVKPLPQIDFSTFILSMSTSVLIHLGELDNPETQRKEINLALARQTIDLLGLIQDKTRGNLDTEEQKLLENLLYDLRMKYVAQCRGG